MIAKHPIRPERLRQVPVGFSWVDHRLIRERRLESCAHGAWALYLFLVTVSDAQGLSYYSEAALGRYLKMDLVTLSAMRHQLVQADLIAYQKPLYQVLSLSEATRMAPASDAPRRGEAQSVGEILRRALGGGPR
jgi:hypothetical protein